MEYDKDQKEIQMIERYLDCVDQDILEVGCGEGHISALLAPKARKYMAIDLDPSRIKKAKLTHPELDFWIGTGEALTFADASFDGVLYTLSLHHQESGVALQEAHRVLKEGGQVVIVEPAADGEFQQFFHLFNDETEALALALKAIKQSDFQLTNHEIFFTEVKFDDREELCSYPFERSSRQADDRDRILGTLKRLHGRLAAVDQPIHLHEKLNIFSLQRKYVSLDW